MNRDLIKEDLIQLDWEVTDRDDYFQKMVCKLEDLGYVRASFKKAILEREEKYPTALPTQPEAIAIPHSDIEHVIKPFIAATRLASPVYWHEMGNNDAIHPVRYIFMLGFTQDDGHVKVLQLLLKNFMKAAYMEHLNSAMSEAAFLETVRSLDGFEDE